MKPLIHLKKLERRRRRGAGLITQSRASSNSPPLQGGLSPGNLGRSCWTLDARDCVRRRRSRRARCDRRGACASSKKKSRGRALRGWGVVGRPAFFFAGSIMGACAPGLHKSFGYCCKLPAERRHDTPIYTVLCAKQRGTFARRMSESVCEQQKKAGPTHSRGGGASLAALWGRPALFAGSINGRLRARNAINIFGYCCKLPAERGRGAPIYTKLCAAMKNVRTPNERESSRRKASCVEI